MKAQRRIDWEWLHRLAWYDVASDAIDAGLVDQYDRLASEWAYALVCFGWCLHDAGALAEATRRGNLAGYAVGKMVGHSHGYDDAECDMRRRRARVDDDED